MTDIAVGLRRAMANHCTPEEVRKLESGGSPDMLWDLVASLGYTDVFVAEAQGGIGLGFDVAWELGFALGEHAYPLPLLETAVARALLAHVGESIPQGPIVLCDAQEIGASRCVVPDTPGLRQARHALIRSEGYWHLVPLEGLATRAGLYRPAISAALLNVPLEDAQARFEAPHTAAALLAPLHAAEIAGALAAVFQMTVAYSSDRRQFGRAIGQFQALQMEISLLAELTAFATMAARMGAAGSASAPDTLRGLNAKLACSDAAERCAAIAHAVHGAIGITEEYALGLHVRRLHEWRGTAPTAGNSARTIGMSLLGCADDTLAFVRAQLASV